MYLVGLAAFMQLIKQTVEDTIGRTEVPHMPNTSLHVSTGSRQIMGSRLWMLPEPDLNVWSLLSALKTREKPLTVFTNGICLLVISLALGT